ncbi:MAG TPA: cytochrome P450 [Polyangiales bacterium]
MAPIVDTVPTLPGGSLLTGHLQEYRRDPIGLLTRAAAHGDVVRARIGLFDVMIVTSPALVQEVLVERESEFIKSFGLSLFAKPLLGQGLVTSEHALHRRQRKLLAPAFVHKRIAGYAEVVREHGEYGLTRMLARGRVEIGEETMATTLGIVAKTLFDAEVRDDTSEVASAITEALESVLGSLTSNIPLPPPIPTPMNLRILRAARRLDRIVYRMIAERGGQDRGDMLSLLLRARDEDGVGMSEKQVRDEVMTAFIAGHETTANALAWALYLLAKNPSARAEVEAELDRVLGGRPARFEDLPSLPSTLRALKEAMRLYPPAYVVTRRPLRELSFGGQRLRKNSMVIVNIYGIHRRADLFRDPSAFLPARFEDERALPRHAYMPFGAGPRTCIGNHFALMEGHLLLSSWLSRARFNLPSPEQEAGLQPMITLRPRAPLTMLVSARNTGTQSA